MNGNASTIDPGSWRSLFGVATAPARLLSRFRPDLRATLVADAATFSGAAARAFLALLTALAVAYPVAASYIHAVGPGRPRAETLTAAAAPFFDNVYSESLPFMLAAAGLGAFSPALGVLFMAVFIPADLIAASRSTVELQALQVFGWFPAPVLGRLISYALLWILAVEIPILARAWAAAWAGRGGRQPSTSALAAVRIGATAILVYFWARALPWLIQVVFNWTPLQFTQESSAPTWYHWPIMLLGATAIAGVAAFWPRPAQLAFTAGATAQPRSLGRLMVRQFIAVVVLAALLAGMLHTVRDALILIAGLIVAGPVLTIMLPHVPVPAAVARAPRPARWVAAMVIALAVSWVILRLSGAALYQDYFVTVLTLAVATPLFRLLLDAGTTPPGGLQAPASVPSLPTAPGISSILLLALGLWLALPDMAWAHDCPSSAELKGCLLLGASSPLGMLAAALLMAGWAMGAFDPPQPPAPPPPSKPPPGFGPPPDQKLGDFDKDRADKSGFTRGPSDGFKNVEKGAGDFLE